LREPPTTEEFVRIRHQAAALTNDAPLRLALHVTTPNTATVDSADEGVAALPVDSITVNGSKLKFEIKIIAGVYEGQIAADSSRITGTWSQDGGVWRLVWQRGDDPANITVPIGETGGSRRGRPAHSGSTKQTSLHFGGNSRRGCSRHSLPKGN
jgi:hypothetical protein